MPNARTTVVAVLTLLLTFNAGAVFAATRTVTLRVSGMTCEGCATTIEKALKETDGVLEARVSYEKGEAWVKYDDRKVSVRKLREVINGTGFKVVRMKAGGAAYVLPAENTR